MRAIALAIGVMLGLVATLVLPNANDGPVSRVPRAPDGATAPTSMAPASPSPAATESAASNDAPAAAGSPAAIEPRAIEPAAVSRSTVAISATYNAYLNVSYRSRRLNVVSTMVARNNSGVGIDRIDLNTIAARLGGLRLTAATVDGRAVRIRRSDQTLSVPLGRVLPSGSSVTMRIGYRAALRTTLGGSDWMFTRANGIVSMYRWLPWVSRAHPFNRPNHGDPFVTPVSPLVRVRIRSDQAMTFATSGRRIAIDGDIKTFLAQNVRDFTVTASPGYRSRATTLGDTVIRVVYRPGAPSTALLAAARRAIGRMEALVGPYPYREFKVVQSSGGFGMESPGLIWIPSGASNISYLVHHETAHQWFYSLVGNDQAREPFTDEAAADFLARYTLGARRASGCGTTRLDLSIYRYSSRCYYEVIYIQGGNFLDDVRRRMGNTPFWRGMRAYVNANRFRLTTTRELLDTLDAHTSLDLRPSFAARFPGLY